MSELDAEISSLYEEMEDFLRLQSRNEGSKNQPLTFRTEYKTNLKLTDSEKNVFEVDESFLSAFRDIYTDKAYKVVRLNNWEFEIKFSGKKCVKIDLICESVTFLATKTIKKEITACHFKIPIIQNFTDAKDLSPEVHGYLNRLSKKNLCEQSFNVADNIKSLLSFAALKPLKVHSFNFRPYNKVTQESVAPLTALSTQGKKILQKVGCFITRQMIHDFMVEQQVSQQSAISLRKLVVGKQ